MTDPGLTDIWEEYERLKRENESLWRLTDSLLRSLELLTHPVLTLEPCTNTGLPRTPRNDPA